MNENIPDLPNFVHETGNSRTALNNIKEQRGELGFQDNTLLIIFFFLYLAVAIGAILDVASKNFKDSINKLIWVIIILVLPLGAFLYLLCLNNIVRNQLKTSKKK